MSRQVRMENLNSIIEKHNSHESKSGSHLKRIVALAAELHSLRRGVWTLENELCEHYVYVYLDPRKPGDYKYTCPSGKVVRFKFQPFYVGKGKDARAFDHLFDSALSRRSHKTHTIKAILKGGHHPIIKTTETPATEFMSLALEIDLIKGIGRTVRSEGPLTNLTAGGDGISGFEFSEASRAQMSLAKLGVKRKPFTAATRKRMSASMRGVPKSDDHKQKLRASLLGSKHSEETKAKRRAALAALPKLTCPHCGKIGQYMNMRGYHMDKCKFKES